MRRRLVETVLGGVVLVVAGYFLVFAYYNSDIRPVEGYELIARFNSIDGLSAGSDVRVSGVKVGAVIEQSVDPDDYRAVITMTIKSNVHLPVDTSAEITADGLLGGKYIRLLPGDETALIAPGGEIANTRDVLSLEDILSKSIFLLTEE